jgi:hypothetical protein
MDGTEEMAAALKRPHPPAGLEKSTCLAEKFQFRTLIWDIGYINKTIKVNQRK